MDLTKENKEYIDSLPYDGLLGRWRFSPCGDEWFQGETGEYWGERMRDKKEADLSESVKASKRIGWER